MQKTLFFIVHGGLSSVANMRGMAVTNPIRTRVFERSSAKIDTDRSRAITSHTGIIHVRFQSTESSSSSYKHTIQCEIHGTCVDIVSTSNRIAFCPTWSKRLSTRGIVAKLVSVVAMIPRTVLVPAWHSEQGVGPSRQSNRQHHIRVHLIHRHFKIMHRCRCIAVKGY